METILIDRTLDGVVTVTLDRPARKNAMTTQMFMELRTAFTDIAANPADRVMVITGAGGAFCSGADLATVGSGEVHSLELMRVVGDCCVALHAFPKPSIAKVVGPAIGAGANLAFGCDLVVASSDARFGEIFVKRGLTIDFGGSWLLPRMVGIHRAKQLAMLADLVGADEALRMGLVNEVVPIDDIDAFVAAWASRLAAGPPLALGMVKRLLNDSLTSTFVEAVDKETWAQTVGLQTADAREAMRAFLDKREPVFQGR